MQIHGKTQNLLSNAAVLTEATTNPARQAKRGELITVPLTNGLYGLAEEGSYFKSMNPTFGTGIAMAITTAFGATTPLMTIRNTETDSTSGKRIYLDYIRLLNTVAGATTTSSQLAVVIDTANRYSTGGTQLTSAGVNSGVSTASIASIFFGAVTATAVSAPRNIARFGLKTQAAPCWVVGDMVTLGFASQQDSGTVELSGTTARNIIVPVSPVVIAPGHTALIYMWNPANATTPPSWEVEIGVWER